MPNETGFVLGPPVGRSKRTGRTASTKYALKKLLSIGQLLFRRGVNPYCEELTSNARRAPAVKPCPRLYRSPGWTVRETFRGESCMNGTNSRSKDVRPELLTVIPTGNPIPKFSSSVVV